MDPRPLLERLTANAVAFVLVGDSAAAVHGLDVELDALQVLFARDEENRLKIVLALADTAPYLRGVPPGMEFEWGAQTLFDSLDLPLTTTLGDLDLQGQYVGGLPYEAFVPFSAPVTAWGVECRALKLDALLELEESAPEGDTRRITALRRLLAELDPGDDDDGVDDAAD